MPLKKTIFCCPFGCGFRADEEPVVLEHERKCPYCPENVAASAWLPMETAPKDGRLLLLIRSQRGECEIKVGAWESVGGPLSGWKIDGAVRSALPIRWLPIPPIPDDI